MNKLALASVVCLSLLFSFVAFVVILVLLYIDFVSLPLAILLTVTLNLIFWLVGPTITDFINRHFYKVQFFSQEEVQTQYPYLYQIITQISQANHFPFPKIGVIPDQNPTAFTYGSHQGNARIVFTQGIPHFLSHEEQQAVIAHELGHVRNRDFIVMMVASTLLQILYEIYAVLIRVKGKKSGVPRAIAIISFVLYQIGIFIIYYLSRTREYLADNFSAQYTSPNHLSNALIKIAYGIVAVEDTSSTDRLLKSTRHLGILDIKNAKHTGAISYITHNNPETITQVAMFDLKNPWAKVLELTSTHPLTGKRLENLNRLATKQHQTPLYNFDSTLAGISLDQGRLYSNFFTDILVIISPYLIAIFCYLFLSPILAPILWAIAYILTLFYRFPSSSEPSTILALMTDPYASPYRGRRVDLNGQPIGKGLPGYIFSDDIMFQDNTGLIFVDYQSVWGVLGNLLFALKKVKNLLGQTATINGWFYRGLSGHLKLRHLHSNDQSINSYPYLKGVFEAIFFLILFLVLSFLLI